MERQGPAAARFSTGSDGTLFLCATDDLVSWTGGAVVNALGLDAVELLLPEGSPTSNWRELQRPKPRLRLDVLDLGDADTPADICFEHRDDGGSLAGPGFIARWHGAHGQLAVKPLRSGRHAYGDIVQSAALAVLIARLILRGGVALHAAALEDKGRVVVAYGPSGAGKSTLANRFQGAVLSDEYAMLEPFRGGWYHALYAERRAAQSVAGRTWLPLAGLCHLTRGIDRSCRRPRSAAAAMLDLLPQMTMFRGLETRALDNATTLLQQAPEAAFEHVLDDEDATAHAALFAGWPR